jgi:copper chaperone CopZ
MQFITGVFIAGLISYLIPDNFFADSGINQGILGMLVMIAIGIPMYVCATASIPIAIALMMKGFSPGTAFAFLAAGPATNAASLSILVKTIGKKTTSIFVGTIALLSMVFGLLLDKIFEMAELSPHSMMMHGSHNHVDGMIPYELKIGVSILFLGLLLMSVYRKYLANKFRKKETTMETVKAIKLNIEGMTCNHCVMNVKKAIEKVEGTSNVNVVLQDNAAYFEGTADVEKVKLSIEDVGYKVVG